MDKIYTPYRLSHRLINSIPRDEIASIVDPACGNGSLLKAASDRYPHAHIYGADYDRKVIRRLNRKYPSWQLSVADFLNKRSRAAAHVYNTGNNINAVLLNPPFSMGNKSYFTSIDYNNKQIRCSKAFYFVYKSLDIFQPELGLFCTLPESSMFSQLDSDVRALISDKWDICIKAQLERSCFDSYNTSTLIVHITKKVTQNKASKSFSKNIDPCDCTVVRGGLPVHKARKCENGVPFLHTTGFSNVFDGTLSDLPTVEPGTNGLIRGEFLLLPRVGNPRSVKINTVSISQEIQISDCVIAVRTHKNDEIISRIDKNNIVSLYKGTGAKYVTKKRISGFLRSMGINASFESASL